MDTKAWHIIRIVLALAGLAFIAYTLITMWGQMNDMTRFVRILGLIIFTVYLISAVLRYRKGSDVSGS
jgi:hypothetical protein